MEKHPWVYKKRNVNYRLNLQNTILYLIEFGKLDYDQKSKRAKNCLMNGRSNDQNHDLCFLLPGCKTILPQLKAGQLYSTRTLFITVIIIIILLNLFITIILYNLVVINYNKESAKDISYFIIMEEDEFKP